MHWKNYKQRWDKISCEKCESKSYCNGKLCKDPCETCKLDDCALCPKYKLCIKCKKPIKDGQWTATSYLHYDCCTEEDIQELRRKAEEKRKNTPIRKRKGMGSHFGTGYDGFCLELWNVGVAQPRRAFGLHPKCQGFKSPHLHQ